MCGIVGIISMGRNAFWNAQQKAFKNLLYLDAFRGEDGTGVFGVTKEGNVQMLKSVLPAGVFVYSDEYKEFEKKMMHKFNIVVGHNRKATVGKITDETAHPFISGNVVMVHNGKLDNHRKHHETEVDSEALCKYLEEHDANLVEAISKLDGAFSVVWYNAQSKKLRFWRNDLRPMFHAIINTAGQPMTYFSSERSILASACARAGVTISDPEKTIYELAPDMLHELDMEAKTLGWVSTDIPKVKKEYPKSTYYSSWYFGQGDDDYSANDDTPAVSTTKTTEKKTTPSETKGTVALLTSNKKKKGSNPVTFQSLEPLLNQSVLFRLVDYVEEPHFHDCSYIEAFFNESTTATCEKVPDSFIKQLENIPHKIKFFKGVVTKIKSYAPSSTFELELDPNTLRIPHYFLEAGGKLVSYESIEEIGGEELIYCCEDQCYNFIPKDDWEKSTFQLQHDAKGNLVTHHIMCPDCTKKYATTKGKVTH